MAKKQPPNGARDPARCIRDPWRPPKYKTEVELQDIIDEYFKHCEKTTITVKKLHSQGVTKTKVPTPPTMIGLAVWLKVSRNHLNEWKKAARFGDTIARARDRIEENNIAMGQVGVYESRINTLNLAANFGYATKTESQLSGPGGGPIEFTDTERAARLAAIMNAAKARKDKDNA